MKIDNYYNLTYQTNARQLGYFSTYKFNALNANDEFIKTSPSFTGANPLAKTEKRLQKIEYLFRIISNRFIDIFESKKHKALAREIAKIKPEQNDKYLLEMELVSRLFKTDKIIDINLEDKILEKIVQSGKSHIFIMNHSSQKRDPSMLAVVSALLSKAYREFGKGSSFPLPKIILNQDILKTMNPIKRKAFEACGAVGIDANIFCADKSVNAKAFLPILKDFIKDKVNIFIFPEGKLSVFKDLDYDIRFQIGIAELINKGLGIKKEISVVPIGFSYGKGKNKLTGIQIGEPVVFKREGETTTTTSGKILKSEFAIDAYKNFFEKHKDKTDVIITENGVPVKSNEVVPFIKGVLSENLNICSKEAQKKIAIPVSNEPILSY